MKKNTRIRIYLQDTCGGSLIYTRVISAYQEGDLYCIYSKTRDGRDIIHKIPLVGILEIEETEEVEDERDKI